MGENGVLKRLALSASIAGIAAILLLVPACSEESPASNEQPLAPLSYEGKRILYINSYHEGPRQGLVEAIQETLADTGVVLKIHYMDTRRNPDEKSREQAALDAKAVIEEWAPDVVITSDDNAFKYLVMPYYEDADLPFVHCGINWDASVYGAPYRNTTGMIEVTLAEQLVEELRNHSNGDRVGFLVMDSSTGHKEGEHFRKVLGTATARYVSTFSEWKDVFVDMQGSLDMMVVGGVRGIADFDENEAREFVLDNIRIPIGANHDPEMPYAMVGFVAIAKEQGEWAARTALRILDGTDPSDIPQVTNKEAAIMVNLDLAEKLDIVFSPEILKNAEIVP